MGKENVYLEKHVFIDKIHRNEKSLLKRTTETAKIQMKR